MRNFSEVTIAHIDRLAAENKWQREESERLGEIDRLRAENKRLTELLREIRRKWEYGVDIEQGTWRTQMERLIFDEPKGGG